VSEPVTLITNLVLAALTGYFTWRLLACVRQRSDLSVRLWVAAFAAAALSALAGASYHGFGAQLGATAGQALWQATLNLAGAANLLLLCAVLCVYSGGGLRLALLAIAVAKLLVMSAWMAQHSEFRYVVYDTVASMLPVLALSAWGAWSRRVPSAPWILAGILASLVAALMQQGRVALHAHFNHNDLYHVIQMVAMYFFYRGGLELRDLPAETAAPAGASAGSES
jgi:hypothetical protein